jgi:hypothetical protein
MTNPKDYFESVRASGRALGFLGLMLGASGGILTGVAVKGLVDEPLVTGTNAVVFYLAFAASSVITLFVMLNYTTLNIRVDDANLKITLGMKSKTIALDSIASAAVAQPKSRMTRVASKQGNIQMWSVLGVNSGVELTTSSEPSATTTFVASKDPEAFLQALGSISADSDDGSGATL